MPNNLACSYAYCSAVARREAGNFYPAFWMLPGPQRRAMCALYAFMRVTDDLTDEPGNLADKQAALVSWRHEVQEALTGQFRHPLHPALAHVIRKYTIPQRYLNDVLDGVATDLAAVHYATFADLYAYCYRVASAVGLACIHIWGYRHESAKKYAESAGIAFQMTNILRDLREDAERGRVYLPAEDLARFDYSAELLRRGERDGSFRALMRFEVERTREYYAAARPLSKLLDGPGRAIFQVMSGTYSGLLDAIERRDYDVFSSRVGLSPWRKAALAIQALPARWALV